MGRPDMHRYRPPRAPGGGFCEGLVQGIYVRKGSGSGRWVRLGEMCLQCQTFWPIDPDATAQEIVERALLDSPSS
jgi:hypothetical protein